MPNPESKNESLNSTPENLPEIKRDLRELESDIGLFEQINKIGSVEIGTLKFERISGDGEYKIYSYITPTQCLPHIIKEYATRYIKSKNNKGIKITNRNGEEFNDFHILSKGEKIFIKMPKNETIQGIPIYENDSQDGKYMVYSYTATTPVTPYGIKKYATLYLKYDCSKEILITDRFGKKLKRFLFSPGEKIYIKIPKRESKENEDSNEEKMKCKWGEYFGIDVSRFNYHLPKGPKESNKKYQIRWDNYRKKRLDKFKNDNRRMRDSNEKGNIDRNRGISFIYIRAGDGAPTKPKLDEKLLETWMNFVKEYNEDNEIKNNKEQIATGLYRRLSLKPGNTGKGEAKTFMEKYNKYKKPGMNQLVPMLDLEDSMFKSNNVADPKKIKETKKRALEWLNQVESETGIIPGLYIGAASYGDFIKNDPQFSKYKTIWIAAYSSSRINRKKGSVKVGGGKRTEIIPTMYQSSKKGNVAGTGTNAGHTDIDHTKDISKLFSDNNLSQQ